METTETMDGSSDSSVEDDDEEDRRRRTQVLTLHQRRRILVAWTILKRKKEKREAREMSSAFSWAVHVRSLTHEEFRARYRLTYDAFCSLLQLISNDLHLNEKQHQSVQNAWGGVEHGLPIPPEVRLAVCLRMCAGASHHDLQEIYKIKASSVYSCLWRCIDAINMYIPITFPAEDIDKLKELEVGFRAKSDQGVWKGCVGCIDGVHFKMRRPSLDEAPNPMRYYVARKAEYALLCMAICDVKRRFIYYSIEMASTTHDSLAWGASDLGAKINQHGLPYPFFLNGDSAFSCSNSMVVPTGTDPDFDFVQSSNRMAIECAFGMLVKRWGILWRSLVCDFDKRAPLIGALMRLHNWCIDYNVPEYEPLTSQRDPSIALLQPDSRRWCKQPVFDKHGRPVQMLNTCNMAPPPCTSSSKSVVRDMLIENVHSLGLKRPALPLRCVGNKKGRATKEKKK